MSRVNRSGAVTAPCGTSISSVPSCWEVTCDPCGEVAVQSRSLQLVPQQDGLDGDEGISGELPLQTLFSCFCIPFTLK